MGRPLFDVMSVRVGAGVLVGISVNESCCSGELLRLQALNSSKNNKDMKYPYRILAKQAMTLPFSVWRKQIMVDYSSY